jgi:hypothetical protein
MDPRFAATPEESEIAAALALWPELASMTIRPLLVGTFGDIYVETDQGEVWLADPIELTCQPIANSVSDLEALFADHAWAEERLMTNLVLLASERGVVRPSERVFALAPHPSFTGSIRVENLVVMDLSVWHHICLQLRGG